MCSCVPVERLIESGIKSASSGDIHRGDNFRNTTSEAPMPVIICIVLNGHILNSMSIEIPVFTVYSTFYKLISSIFLIGISIYAARL